MWANSKNMTQASYWPEILAQAVNIRDVSVEGGVVVVQEAGESIIAEKYLT